MLNVESLRAPSGNCMVMQWMLPMLADDGLRIYADDFAVGEGELNLLACLLVLFRLIIGWINHSLVEYQEVGVGGRQAVSLALRVGGEAVALIIDRVGHRQFEQAVRDIPPR